MQGISRTSKPVELKNRRHYRPVLSERHMARQLRRGFGAGKVGRDALMSIGQGDNPL